MRSYGTALLCVALALGMTLLLLPWLSPTITPLFLLAVMVSAWYGGGRAGLLATVLSTLAINYFLIEPFYSLHILNLETVVRLSTFLIAAGLISSLNQSRRTALKNARENLQALQAAMSREQAALAEVETSRQRLETVLSSIDDGFYVLDRDWQFTYVNDRYCEMVAMQPSALLGQNIWELFPGAIGTEADLQFHQAVDEQIPLQFDYLGSPWNCWHDYRIYPSPSGLTVLIADISDRKRAELNSQFLNQLDAQLQQLSSADEILWETISRLGEYLNVDRCVWHGVNLTENLVSVEQEWRQTDVPNAVGVHQLSDFISPELQIQHQAGQVIVISDVTTNVCTAFLAANYTSFGARALILVPCLSEGHWVAVLAVTAKTVRHWRSDEVSLLQETAARLWSVIEHTRVVQQLHQNEAEFRQLANAMPQIVWISKADGALEFINDRWTEYTGLTLAQSRDRTLIDKLIPPAENQQLYANFVQAQETRSPYQAEFRLIQPDGSYFYFLARAVPLLDQQGQVYKWYGTSTDITSLKQLEVELRQKNAILDVINESAPAPIFVKDRQGHIIYANPATLEVLGKSVAEVIGYRDCDLYPNPEDAARVMANDRRIMEAGQMEVVEESPDGIRTFLGMKVPYRNETGDVIGLIGISNDITDRVQLERDREQLLHQEQAAREAAENANRIKDEFLAVLSHELRSPLNPILGWSKLLQSRKFDEARTAEALATIERNAKLQSELIEDLLDVSRILQGKLSLNPCPINLVSTIQAALETVRLAAEAKFIQIETYLDLEVGLVSGDAARLQQVVWNLLSNAVKFTPNRGRVEIALRSIEDHAQITIRDTGKGIDPHFLPHVFDYFRQEDSAITRKFGGLGLGLAIVRQIVEMHGGTVSVESQGENQGATFTVQLPVMQQIMPIVPEPICAQINTENTEMPLDKIKILLVDDDTDAREFQAFLLEQSGAKVTAVTSGLEALQVLDQSIPEVIISDVGMAKMDGYMLMQQIRSREAAQSDPSSLDQEGTIPAIALTAYAGEIDQTKALQAGFQMHITKPVEPERLISAIVRLLNQKQP
jgi:PAS domain S-box-containing protein